MRGEDWEGLRGGDRGVGGLESGGMIGFVMIPRVNVRKLDLSPIIIISEP